MRKQSTNCLFITDRYVMGYRRENRPLKYTSFEMPAIRDYSLDNIRLTPPQIYTPPMHIYEPPAIIDVQPMHIYEPPVYIPPTPKY